MDSISNWTSTLKQKVTGLWRKPVPPPLPPGSTYSAPTVPMAAPPSALSQPLVASAPIAAPTTAFPPQAVDTTDNSLPPLPPPSAVGGRRRRRKHAKTHRGGAPHSYLSATNLAANASPFSSGPTAKVHNWVGGRSRRRRHRHRG